VAHGLANAERLIQRVRSGGACYHFIEVMACPGGCIGGGGQPRFTTNEVRLARMKAIFSEDEGKRLRVSLENPTITRLYQDFLGQPLGEKSHRLLHTHYGARPLN
jgi:NADH-quinone oxidoreductase subunit G/NADP-reducing hydrogenase subunit HndD